MDEKAVVVKANPARKKVVEPQGKVDSIENYLEKNCAINSKRSMVKSEVIQYAVGDNGSIWLFVLCILSPGHIHVHFKEVFWPVISYFQASS